MSYSRENLIIKEKGSNIHYIMKGDYLTVYTDLMLNGYLGEGARFEKVQAPERISKRFSLPNGDEINGILHGKINGLRSDIPFIGNHMVEAVETVEFVELYELHDIIYTKPEMVQYIKDNFKIPEGKVINLSLKDRRSVFIEDEGFGGDIDG